MSIKRDQTGFHVIETVLIVIVVALIGFVGWFVYHTNQVADTNYQVDDNAVVINKKDKTTELDKTYVDPVGDFSVKYPSTWSVKTTAQTKDKDTASSDTTITSPGGSLVHLMSNWGGKGGNCDPEPGDKPFAKGNACPTLEFLTSESLPINNVYYQDSNNEADGTVSFTTKKTAVMLFTSHYGQPNGKSTYYIGVTGSTPGFTVTTNDPQMGAVMGAATLTVYDSKGTFHPYVNAYASGSTEAFLQTKDATTIKAILRTLKINL